MSNLEGAQGRSDHSPLGREGANIGKSKKVRVRCCGEGTTCIHDWKRARAPHVYREVRCYVDGGREGVLGSTKVTRRRHYRDLGPRKVQS